MEQPVINNNLICRTCKSASTAMRNVFEGCENENDVPRIDEMLMACTSIQASVDDGLPQLICQTCLEQLRTAFAFKEKALKTEASLKQTAKNLKDVKQELAANNDFIETLNTLLENTARGAQETTDNTQSMTSDFIQILENNQILLTCRECLKMFTTLEGLRCHKRVHLGSMFKCKTCDREYTRLNHLQRHELSHGRKKVHVCRICNKTLTRMEHLRRHLTIHLKEKPFSCKTCNRGFNRLEHLNNHTPRCKGEIVHICDICNKAFNRQDSLDVHKRMHDVQAPVLPTLESLDNIEEHYYEIDFDGDPMQFSDTSDVEDCFEPQVEVTESFDEDNLEAIVNLPDSEAVDLETLKEEIEEQGFQVEQQAVTNNVQEEEEDDDHDDDDDDPINDTSSIGDDLDKSTDKDDNDDIKIDGNVTPKREDSKTEIELSDQAIVNIVNEMEADAEDQSLESSDDEYQPTKKSSGKRRGRPPKDPNNPPKPKTPKVPGRGRGRPPGSTNVIRVKKEMEEEGDFPCPVCNEMFRTALKLDRHARKQHEGMKIHKCTSCNKEFDRANHLKRHMMSHSAEKPYQCEICTKSFNRKDHLAQHQKLHGRPQDFICDVCQKPFNRADHLAKHKAYKHGIGEKLSAEKKFGCPLCNKFFTTEKYRDIHVKGHNGEKEYTCKTCQKSFLSKSHLTEHMKFHNDHSKKFLCSECGQRFIRNDYLVIHMRRHRGEKPFKCKFCGKGFPRTTDLTVHERYHTGEKTHLCTICGRGFGRAYNLTVHMRTHTGEKPYQCTYCEAAFAQGNDLKAHIRRHTGERFQCDHCSESFLMGYLLTQHKRTVHGLNVVSNIRRLQPVHKIEDNPDEPPPITIPLPKPVVPDSILNSLQHQLAVAQFHHLARPEQQFVNRPDQQVNHMTTRPEQQIIHITRPDQIPMPLHHM